MDFNRTKTIGCASVFLVSLLTVKAQRLEPYQLKEYEIRSEVLKENRNGKIYGPEGNHTGLITFYVLDGEWNMDYIRNTIDFYRRWNRIPDVRVVSIDHENRTKDLTPTEDVQAFPGSGNAVNFLLYVNKELKPYIDKNYGRASQNVLIGHSFGGLFALYTLGTVPESFDGYIAISPSTWWNDKFLFGLDYGVKLNTLKKPPFIYITTAEFDSGVTRPSNTEFLEWLEKQGLSASIKIDRDFFEGENHFTNVTISFQQALNKLFPGPGLRDKMEQIYSDGGLTQLKEWYKTEKNKLKERLIFPEEALLGLALQQIQSQKNAQATDILEWLLHEKPDSGNGYYYLGYNEVRAGHIENGKAAYQKALTKELPERVKTVVRKNLGALNEEQRSGSAKLLEGIVSTDAVEYGVAVSKSQDSIFFVRHNGNWGSRDNPPSNIFLTTKTNGSWSTPVLASFSMNDYDDADVFIAADNSIFFTSNRPYQGKIGVGSDIFQLVYSKGKWGDPKPLERNINSESMESSPVTNEKGDLYFSSTRKGGVGMGDIYIAKKTADGSYVKPTLVSPVSTEYGEWNVFISPDDSYMIFEGSGRPGAKSAYGDFYYSKNNNGTWQEPKPLSILNTTGSELNIRLSPDSQEFYFASSERLESRDVDIFTIPAGEIMKIINQ